jgi:hypothetical protein
MCRSDWIRVLREQTNSSWQSLPLVLLDAPIDFYKLQGGSSSSGSDRLLISSNPFYVNDYVIIFIINVPYYDAFNEISVPAKLAFIFADQLIKNKCMWLRHNWSDILN